jgi:hypothetical protein
VNKQISHRFNLEGLKLKTLNEVENERKYRFGVSNWFAALVDLDAAKLGYRI